MTNKRDGRTIEQVGDAVKDRRMALQMDQAGLARLAEVDAKTVRSLELFEAKFHLAFPDYKLKTESVVESEAWLEAASLVRISAHVHGNTGLETRDAANLEEKPLGELAHTLVPPRGSKYLPRFIYDRLQKGTLKPGKLLHFADDDEPTEVEATLEYNGQKKTFIIGKEKRPAISYLLSDHGQDVFSADKIRKYALDRAPELFRRAGIDWKETSAVGMWTKEALAVRLVNRDEQQS